MVDLARIEELRRRVQKDPASIAFAQLAEEFRRAGRLHESVETCQAGLARHPGYLSARVTLGRALLELGELDKAQDELKRVLRAAPENLAALKGLAEVHHRRGELEEALNHYQAALELAQHDLELERIVEEIGAQIHPASSGTVASGMSFDEMQRELLSADAAPQQDEGHPVATLDPVTDDNSAPSAEATPPRAESARPDVGALERWLDAIVAERERRQ